MTQARPTAARIRRLAAEIGADRQGLRGRGEEVRRYHEAGGEAPERTAALALALDRAYTALEAILERIARTLEGDVPSGEDWHRELLRNAELEIEQVRPAVLSADVVSAADDLRRFRHFLRHAYAASLNPDRVRAVAAQWLTVAATLERDLDEFEKFLGSVAETLDRDEG